VASGKRVEVGDPLVRLANQELLALFRQAKADLAMVTYQVSALEVTDVAAAQAISERVPARQARLDDLAKKVESLTLRAAIDGVIITGHLDELTGHYIATGDEIMTVVDAGRPLLRAAINQEDVYEYRDAVGKPVEVRLRADPATIIAGRIDKISPRSSHDVPHPALTTKAGEDLLLDPASEPGKPKLLYPCFVAEIVPDDPALRLRGGSLARVRFEAVQRPLAVQWYRKAVRLFRSMWL
jgi:multidrug resistance efflux pump